MRLLVAFFLLCFLAAVAMNNPAALSLALSAFLLREHFRDHPRRSTRRDV